MRRWSVLRILIAVGLLLPSNQSARFSGLPLATVPEILALLVLLYSVFIHLARQHERALTNPIRTPHWAVAVGIGVIVLKLILFFSVPTSGRFEVCYQATDETFSTTCLPTFEPHPEFAKQSEFFPSRSTDVRKINFGPRQQNTQSLSGSTWRLPFVNSFKYDEGYRSWIDDDLDVEIFPFRATFKAHISLSQNELIRITYVGEAQITNSNKQRLLIPSYDSSRTVEIGGVTGDTEFEVKYAFLRTQTNDEHIEKPYAQLRVERVDEDGIRPLIPTMPLIVASLILFTDGLTVLLLGLLLWQIRRHITLLLVSIVLGLALQLSDFQIGLPILGKVELGIVLVALLLIGVLRGWWSTIVAIGPILVASGKQVLSEVQSITGSVGYLDQILVRLRGNDHLVYHSLVREMLETGFLRGGENVFYFQPGIRYFFYLQGVLFGESSVISGTVSTALLGLGILAVVSGLRSQRWGMLAVSQLIGIVSLTIWWSSSHTTQSAVFGLSEFGTWILLLFVFGLVIRELSPGVIVLIGVLLSWIVWIRPNQGIAMIGLGLAVVMIYRRQTRVSIFGSLLLFSVFFASLLLIPIHNVAFGNVFVILPNGHLAAEQQSWSTILRVMNDPDTQTFLLAQLRALLYLPSVLSDLYSARLAIAFVGFFLAFIASLCAIFRKDQQSQTLVALLYLLPVFQVVPFLKYTLIRYYPIHIVAIYLTLVLSTLAVTTLGQRAKSSETGLKSNRNSRFMSRSEVQLSESFADKHSNGRDCVDN